MYTCSEQEFEQYKQKWGTKLPSWLQPEDAGYIHVLVPGVLNTMLTSKEKTIKDVRFQLRLMLRDQFRKIEFNPSYPKTQEQTVLVALHQAAIYGCNSQFTEVSLLETGFCWTRDRGASIKLAYPKGVLLEETKWHMDSISSIIRSINTGAVLEYAFLFAEQNGVTAKCMMTRC